MFAILRPLFIVVCLMIPEMLNAQTPLSPGFNFQGRYEKDGAPVDDGAVNLRFSLWNAAGSGIPPVGGGQIGASQIVANIPVQKGVFTVILNASGEFGPEAFNGEERWLQIEDCIDAGCGSLSILSPRQPVVGTPYSLQTRGLRVDEDGKVGVGTMSPHHQLRVSGGPPWTSEGWAGSIELDNRAAIGWNGNSGGRHFGIVQGSGGLYFINSPDDPGATEGLAEYPLTIRDSGFVGIGTVAPAKSLSIAGDAEIGTSHGDYRHLRIGGGNSSGFIYGSYPKYGDGIHMGYNYYADSSGTDQLIRPDGGSSRITTSYGSVAIGTGGIGEPPIDRLVVDSLGNVKLGANTQLYAPGGEENLRIIRGSVDKDGDILAGAGFTVNRKGAGVYHITFNTPFSEIPTATATVRYDGITTIATMANQTNGELDFGLLTTNGVLRDEIFHFIIMGAR